MRCLDWLSTTKFLPVPPYTGLLPTSTNQNCHIVTQCRQVTTGVALYWPSTNQSKPTLPYTDPAPSNTDPVPPSADNVHNFSFGIALLFHHLIYIAELSQLDQVYHWQSFFLKLLITVATRGIEIQKAIQGKTVFIKLNQYKRLVQS